MRTETTLLLFFASLSSAQQCYTPDGGYSPDIPCNSSTPFSACCTSTGYCLSNGLCIDSGIISRGSCTDRTWKSEYCAQYCQDSNPSGGYALMSCTNTTFTCGFYPENCDVPGALFTIENAATIVLRDYQLYNAVQAAHGADGAIASACTSAISASELSDGSGGKRYSAISMMVMGVVLAVVFLAIIAGLVILLLKERKMRFRAQNQSEKNGHGLLQQPAHSLRQQMPTYACYGSQGSAPNQESLQPFRQGGIRLDHRLELHSSPFPRRAELENSHAD